MLDPFAGCATTAGAAAERLGRRWVGIDISAKAAELVELRLVEQLGLAGSLAVHRTDQPLRTDLGDLPAPGAGNRPCTANKPATVRGAATTSRYGTWRLTISYRRPTAALTTATISSCCAGLATGGKAPGP